MQPLLTTMLKNPESEWLARRSHPDLPRAAEYALREAGLAFSHAEHAERHLARAAALAPDHDAVIIAHYRYYLYKHRFADALPYAERCIKRSAERLGVAVDLFEVTALPAAEERLVRAYLFACQAYGYILVRSGETDQGRAVLKRLIALDEGNQSRTQELWQAMHPAADEADD